jgi:hypothetical protein
MTEQEHEDTLRKTAPAICGRFKATVVEFFPLRAEKPSRRAKKLRAIFGAGPG